MLPGKTYEAQQSSYGRPISIKQSTTLGTVKLVIETL